MRSLYNKLKDNKILSKFTVVRQVQLGFALLILITIIASVIILYNTNKINSQIHNLNKKVIPVVKVNDRLFKDLSREEVNIYRWRAELGSLNLKSNKIQYRITELKSYLSKQKISSELEQLEDLNVKFKNQIKELLDAKKNNLDQTMILYNITDLNSKINQVNSKLSNYSWDRLDNVMGQIMKLGIKTRTNIIIVAAINLLFGIFLCLIISQRVHRLTTDVKNRTYQAVNGCQNLTESAQNMQQIADKFNQDLNGAVQSINNLIEGNNQVESVVGEVSVAIKNVAEGVEELLSKSEVISSVGKDTYQMIELTDKKIDIGNRLINNTVNVMRNLQDSINRVSDISNKIMSIADQTNLLALNAAIEAARHGESGQGFAVVADEIKDLAIESMEANQEVKDIIQEVELSTSNAVAALISGHHNQEESLVDIFTEISQLSDKVTSEMDSVMGLADEQLSASQELGALAQQISAASQEAAVQTEDSLSAIEGLGVKMGELISSNNKLYDKVNQQLRMSQEQLKQIQLVVEDNEKLSK